MRSAQRAAAVLIAGACGAAPCVVDAAQPAIRPDIVAQIVSIAPPGSGDVRVAEGRSPSAPAKPYQPLYPGDVVTVSEPGVSATVVLAGGPSAGVTLTSASAPFVAPPSQAGSVEPNVWLSFVQNLPFIASPPPSSSAAVSTTPRSLRADPSRYLPFLPQVVRAGEPADYLVVWRGAANMVEPTDKAGAVVASATPGARQYAVLACPALNPGPYALHIGFSIVIVSAVGTPPPSGSPIEQTISADQALGHRGGELQALADLQALSQKVYVAEAVLRRIEAAP